MSPSPSALTPPAPLDQATYRFIVACNPRAMWLFDEDTLAFLDVNQAAIDIYGYSREEFLAMKTTEIAPSSRTHVTKSGDRIDVAITSTRVTIDGRAMRLVSVRDLSDHKLLEEQRQQAQRIETVDQLAGGVAHDFNNQLAAIIGHADVLSEYFVPGDPREVEIAGIRNAAVVATSLTRQLVAFSRSQLLEATVLDLNEVLDRARSSLVRLIGEHIELVTDPAPSLQRVNADPDQVEQILLNLAVNSRDAMPQGGRLTLRTRNVSVGAEEGRRLSVTEGDYVALSVADTGVGIDDSVRMRLFEPFFTTKGQDKGTGLGLAVVYGVVKQHNGFIHVYSEPGKGTTFRIYFPAVDVPPDSKVAAAREIIHGGNETILLAEDNESVRHLAEQTLITYGYRVLTACDGEEAADIFLRHKKEIAIAVLDVVMPKMGGKQAYDGMVAMAPGLKVLFISGYSANAIHDSFVVHQGLPFLQKPFGPSDLARMVREVLDGEGC